MKKQEGGRVKIGRNDPCPCGSGKKFKKCCQETAALILDSFVVTTEAIIDLYYEDEMQPDEKEKFDSLAERIYQGDFSGIKNMIKDLLDFKKKYPQKRRIYNLLGGCYEKANKMKKAEVIVNETYERFPDYLFAQAGYVSYCMKKGDYDKFDEVFKGAYELTTLFPERRKFHIAEAVSFYAVCGRYWGNKGNMEKASYCLEIVRALEGDESSIVGLIEADMLKGQLINSFQGFREKLISQGER